FGGTDDPAGITVSNTMALGGTLTGNFVENAPSFGSKYKFATAGSFAGGFETIAVEVNGVVQHLLRGRTVIEGDPTAYLLIAPASYTQMALNQNQSNVALALNSFIPPSSVISVEGNDSYAVSLALDSLTASQYPNAFQQICPALYSSFSTTAFNIANAQNQEILQRLGNIRVAGTGFNTMGLNESPIQDDNKDALSHGKDVLIPSVDNHWGIYVDGNGIFANVNINNQLPGYNAESGGVTLGGTYKWNETFSTGLYAGYQGMQSKQNGGSSIIDNSARFGCFGTYQRGGVFVNAILGGDSHAYQVSRNIAFPGINRTATSTPTSGELDSLLAVGYDVKRGNFTFGPISSLQYTYLGLQPFNESGAQSLNLNVQSQNAESLIYSLGTHCFYNWQINKNVLVTPQVSLSWQHEFLQNPYAINSSLQGGGGTFNYTTTAPLRDSVYTGVGFTVNFAKKYDASFFYNTTSGNSNLMSQNIFTSLGVKF
ncbi:MAG: autotransporter outer membrane beta-barrel domain-containing protein, partial [Chthoniobacterales bacterium]